MKRRIIDQCRRLLQNLQSHVTDRWFPPFMAVLSAADALILILPMDGILISAVMVAPRRWFWLGFWTGVGSTVGALILGILVRYGGLPWVLHFYPGIDQTPTWQMIMGFFDQYGLLFLFFYSATPLVQMPAIILASLAHATLWQLTLAVFLGRVLKALFIAYISSHAPKLLTKLWGLKGEMREVEKWPHSS